MEKYDLVLLQFTTSSCNVCLYLERTLYDLKSQATKIMIDYNKTIYIAKVNLENDEYLREKFSIYKFPALQLINNQYNTQHSFPLETIEATVPKILSFIDA